jgi:hypothetical protein
MMGRPKIRRVHAFQPAQMKVSFRTENNPDEFEPKLPQ